VEQISLFEDRPPALQLIGGIGVPMVFGLVTGFALAWNEVAYLVLVGPVGIAGGLLAGMEHRSAEEGLVRGLIGGLVFSSFILLALEILNQEPTTDLPDPQAGLVFFITLVSGGLGAIGGAYRTRVERRAAASGRRLT
jgi:hypothetical protein